MYLRPLTFVIGAGVSLVLLFVGKARFDGGHTWYRSYHLGNESTAQVVATSNTVKEVPDVVEYSVREHVTNSTLGFEKVIAIGLPERTDRRDQLMLMASYQQVKLTWMDAVKGESMDKKAWPYHWYEGGQLFTMGRLGCWRSHLNALRMIVERGYSTALIIEDDADWDVDLKEQLTKYANGTRNLDNDLRSEGNKLTAVTPSHSPYGDYWDLLWLGSCANPPGPEDAQLFDGKQGQVHWVWREKSNGMACTFGYAVTFESARELLAVLQDPYKPFDLMLGSICATRECVVTWPELIGMHRPAGSSIKDSDIDEKEPEVRTKGYTPHVVDSAILDAFERVKGERRRERPNLYGGVMIESPLEGVASANPA